MTPDMSFFHLITNASYTGTGGHDYAGYRFRHVLDDDIQKAHLAETGPSAKPICLKSASGHSKN